jgi:WhiB family redox-sensing transcriptional regulator
VNEDGITGLENARTEDLLAALADGLCAGIGGDVFFPVAGESNAAAVRVCGGCPVRVACLEYVLRGPAESGVWGGTSDLQRRRMRKARQARAALAEVARAEALA